ncbi:Transferase [Corchorus olitorius]|uniref:Transferase n=1 Tax=Corchorus olitorius TaxID=93759 RepID=A0A1R3IGS9_9ROSI|nr:Transferase [Corchorus olitorius]
MALSSKVRIHEISRINPSTYSPKPTKKSSSPLTFFDIFWFNLPPVDYVLFYQLTKSASTPSYFYSEIVPKLKQSLSLALLHYLPLAGKLKYWQSDSPKPIILYTPNDEVSLTIAESNARNFDTLSSNDEIHKANELHPLVSELMISDDTAAMMSLQITLFPGQGFCIGLKIHHVVADGKGTAMFIKSCGHLFKQYYSSKSKYYLPPDLIPFLDRSVVKSPAELDLSEVASLRSLQEYSVPGDLVRATFELSCNDIKKLKQKALESSNSGKLHHLSTFVLAYAYTDMARASPLPMTYFGNCVMAFKSSAKAKDFMDGINGYSFAVNMIGYLVNQVNNGVKGTSQNHVSTLSSISNPDPGTLFVTIFGSPQLEIYGSDFGLGRLKKVEIVSIDHRSRAISMTESRDGSGGIEVGLALKKGEMNKFIASFISDGFEKHLNYILSDGREGEVKERRRNKELAYPYLGNSRL